MNRIMKAFPLLVLLGTTACVSTPTGPSVMVLPGNDKGFEEFQEDDSVCREFAGAQLGDKTADAAAAASGVRSAAVGTVIGAAAGAAIGGNSGSMARGAGAGLALGGLSGTGAGQTSASRLQQRYDIGYQQCMYAKGHRIPASGGLWGEYFNRSGGRYYSRP